MMIVDDIFTLPDKRKAISGHSLWDDNVRHAINDILVCGELRWKVVAVERIHQGCFMAPKHRQHALILEGIGHNDMPQVGTKLNKENEAT